MTTKQHQGRLNTPSMVASRRIREVRKKRNMTTAQLATKCEQLGMPDLNTTAITNIEIRRRKNVNLEQLMTLALALDVAPLHLIVPLETDDDYTIDYWIAAPDVRELTLTFTEARNWITGTNAPDSVDPRNYYSEVPLADHSPDQPTQAEVEELGKQFEQIKSTLEAWGWGPSGQR